jgi:ABC-type glycerol-3-phosphate transport system permease component
VSKAQLAQALRAPTWSIPHGRVSAGTLARHLFVLGVLAIVLLPFAWVVLLSFRPYADLVLLPPTFLPRVWTLGNYAALFSKNIPLTGYFVNSAIVTGVVVPIVVFVACLAGYGFARLRFPGRDAVFWVLVASIFLPVGFPRLITIYELTSDWGLIDTLPGLILPYLSLGIIVYVFIMRNIFLDIPSELEDAARIDGANSFGVFWRIMLPLAAPGAMMVAMLAFLTTWGEYLFAVTLTTSKALTLPVALTLVTSETEGDTVLTVLATAYVLAMLPPLCMYIGLNRWFRAGLAQGALKF